MPAATSHTRSIVLLIQSALVFGALVATSTDALAQSASRAAFVANNGNLEGSVTAFRIEADGLLTFVNRVITGTRSSLSDPCAGCNASAISIAPSGQYLATGHPAGDAPLPDGITIFEVASDASISQVVQLPLFNLGSPMDVQWLSDTRLAVTRANLSGGSQVAVYAFNAETPSLSAIDTESTGSFNTALAFDPADSMLFAQDSTGNMVFSFLANPDGSLTPIDSASSGGVYPLGIGVAPNGHWLYGGGGISAGSHAVVGFSVDKGNLALLPGSPFTSPGTSPKQVAVSLDNAFAYAAHGTDATIRGFSIDPKSGTLTDIAVTFDVGVQGSLGEIAMLDGLLLATDRDTIIDGQRGLYSFTIQNDGSLSQNGTLTETQGIGPNGIAPWDPPATPDCPADLSGDGEVGAADLGGLLAAWNSDPGGPPDFDGDGTVGPADLAFLLANWGSCK